MRDKAVVTGASSGVGREICIHLMRKGMSVIAVSRRSPLNTGWPQDLETPEHHSVDLSDIDATAEWARRTAELHSDVRVIVNCAGVMSRTPVSAIRWGQLVHDLTVNAFSAIEISRAWVPHMGKRGSGSIVNITSGAPLNCYPDYGLYSTSKAALNALTMTLAREVAGTGVSVCLMSPGPVRSEMAPEAPLPPSACLATLDFCLGLTPNEASPGHLYWLGWRLPIVPDLRGVFWALGRAEGFERIYE